MRQMMSFVESTHTPAARPILARTALAVRHWWQSYRHKRRLKATVMTLHGLDDRTLKDIGLNRSEIESVVLTGGRDRTTALDTRISIGITRG